MVTGLDNALGEITLVLFTTLAPSGVIAFILMGLPLLRGGLEADLRRRINQYLSIPLVTSMVGLVASATHLGNPANALYVFLGVGRSPLSTEVFCAVVFLALAGVYWLYSFAERPRVGLQRVWMALAMAAGVVFVTAVAFAYAAETIISWYTVYVPLNLWLNALFGGPLLALLSLRVAGFDGVTGRFGRVLVIVSAAALAANVVSFGLQSADLPSLANEFTTAAGLVPYYGAMIAAFGLCGLAAVGLMAQAVFRLRKLAIVRGIAASAIAFSGIFIMRFAFYMMHMTVGLGV